MEDLARSSAGLPRQRYVSRRRHRRPHQARDLHVGVMALRRPGAQHAAGGTAGVRVNSQLRNAQRLEEIYL